MTEFAGVGGVGPMKYQISTPATPAGLALDVGVVSSRQETVCCNRWLESTTASGLVVGIGARVRVLS